MASGSSDAARWISEYQPSTAAQPSLLRRPHQPAQVTDLVGAVREPPARLDDHARRQVDPGRVRSRGREVRRGVAWPAADLHDRAAVRVCDHPVQQPALEGQTGQLVEQVLGVRRGDGVVRRTHPLVAGLCSVREHAVTVDLGRRSDVGSCGRLAETVHPAVVVLAGLARKLADQPTLGHPGEGLLGGLPVGERVHPLGAGAQLARRLGAAQQQHREQRPFVVGQVEVLVEDLVVLQRAPAGRGPDDPQQPAVLEPAADLLDGLLVVVDHRVAAAALVAGGAQRVEGQRVAVRHRALLLQQAAQDALLLGIQLGEIGHKETA